MKVAFLNDQIFRYAVGDTSVVGGSERQQWLLARALASAGWTISVGIRHGVTRGERRVIDQVEFVGIKRGHHLLDWYRFLSSTRPHWLYWRGATHLLGPLVQIAHVAGVQTIFAAAFDSDVHPRSALTARRRWWPLYLWGLSKTDRIFVQHGGQLKELPLRWRGKASLIRSVAEESDGFASHSLRDPYVAWIGMLRQPKRPDLLVEIAQRSPDVRFVVCGGTTTHRSISGYSQKIIDRFCALPNIDYRGQVAPQDAEQIIARAGVLLCTSDQEGFPNTFLQAWSHGTPVVTMQVDPDSVIKRQELGMGTATIEATIEELHRLLNSPTERQKVAVRCREHIYQNHRAEVIAQAFASATR